VVIVDVPEMNFLMIGGQGTLPDKYSEKAIWNIQ